MSTMIPTLFISATTFSPKGLRPFQVAVESRAFLAGEGVDLSGEQQTKTRTALEFFSANATGA